MASVLMARLQAATALTPAALMAPVLFDARMDWLRLVTMIAPVPFCPFAGKLRAIGRDGSIILCGAMIKMRPRKSWTDGFLAVFGLALNALWSVDQKMALRKCPACAGDPLPERCNDPPRATTRAGQ